MLKNWPTLHRKCYYSFVFVIVYGDVLSKKFDNFKVDKIIDAKSKVMYFRLAMEVPDNQLLQRFVIKFDSAALKSETNCSNRFVRGIGYYKEASTTHLTEKLCGSALDVMHVMKYRPWRENVIEYHFGDASSVDLSFQYGIGKKCYIFYR